MSDLGWESLQNRRLHNRLTMMYKVTNGLVEVPQEYHPVPCLQYTRGHPRQFEHFQPAVDTFKYVFLPQTIPAWNALPQVVVEADSLDTFKTCLSLHQQFWSSASCTMYIVHICSTTHLFVVAVFSRCTCLCRCWSPWPRSHQWRIILRRTLLLSYPDPYPDLN